jgi:hypothetical protein
MESRLTWTDEQWATYLNCPVASVKKYKQVLENNYVTAIEKNKKTNLYSFAVYKYDIAPSGAKRLQLLLSDDKHTFSDLTAALNNANNIISTMELSDYVASVLSVPKQAIQMLLIRQK